MKEVRKMVFKRKIYGQLLEWKNSASGEKALLIEGARRIGKSTIVEEFAKKEYKSYILIDFNDASKAVKTAFSSYLDDLDNFFLILSTAYGVTLYPRESLIIFDEVQRFPKARQSIKKLVKDGRYDYLETGSLISIRENVKKITIPSEERSIKMYPMDFEEFLWALGESQMMSYIRNCYESRLPLTEELHHKAMMLFRQYILVGGMPKVVDKYLVGGRSFAMADEEKADILALYRNDIMKIKRKYRRQVLSIYDQIPAFLSKHEKRVRISSIEGDRSLPAYEDSFFWLNDYMIANECFLTSDPNVGLSLNEERTFIKLYMGDTGLLVRHTFEENEAMKNELYREILLDKLSINEGMFFENAVAQELVSKGHKLYFYTQYNEEKGRNDIEIDFLLSRGTKTRHKICPIEVKPSKKYSTVSLERFLAKYHSRIEEAYIIHPKNLSVKGEIVYLPSYMAGLL